MSKAKAKKGKTAERIAARVAALPPEAAETLPSASVDVLVLEAEQIARAGAKLARELAKLPGFDMSDLELLEPVAEEVAQAERAWRKARLAEAADGHKESRKEAERLRASLLAAGRYLFRKDDRALRELDAIAEGDGIADLIADLRELATFVRARAAVFAAAPGLDGDLPARLTELADELARVPDRSEALEAQARRNQLVAVLEGMLKEVRAAARFLLRDKPKRLGPFLSLSAKERARRRRVPAGPTPVPA
jgi:hypothetical protein